MTNHHVVEPWWQNQEFGDLKAQGVQPVITEMTAYFPGSPNPYPRDVLNCDPLSGPMQNVRALSEDLRY